MMEEISPFFPGRLVSGNGILKQTMKAYTQVIDEGGNVIKQCFMSYEYDFITGNYKVRNRYIVSEFGPSAFKAVQGTSKIYPCPNCNEYSLTPETLKHHVLSKHSYLGNIPPSPTDDIISPYELCRLIPNPSLTFFNIEKRYSKMKAIEYPQYLPIEYEKLKNSNTKKSMQSGSDPFKCALVNSNCEQIPITQTTAKKLGNNKNCSESREQFKPVTKSFQCSQCGYSASTYFAFKYHMTMRHNVSVKKHNTSLYTKIKPSSGLNGVENPEKFCTDSRNKFNSRDQKLQNSSTKKSVLQSGSDPFKCALINSNCEQIPLTQTTAKKLENYNCSESSDQIKPVTKSFLCSQCDYSASTSSVLKRHKTIRHTESAKQHNTSLHTKIKPSSGLNGVENPEKFCTDSRNKFNSRDQKLQNSSTKKSVLQSGSDPFKCALINSNCEQIPLTQTTAKKLENYNCSESSDQIKPVTKSFLCSQCDYSASTSSVLKRHKTIRHTESAKQHNTRVHTKINSSSGLRGFESPEKSFSASRNKSSEMLHSQPHKSPLTLRDKKILKCNSLIPKNLQPSKSNFKSGPGAYNKQTLTKPQDIESDTFVRPKAESIQKVELNYNELVKLEHDIIKAFRNSHDKYNATNSANSSDIIIKQELPENKSFSCKDCDYIAKTSRALTFHKHKNHGKLAFSCTDCDFSYNRISYLHRHQVKVHNYQPPYACRECDVRKTTKVELKVHVLMTHPVKKAESLTCSQCDFSTESSSALKEHVMKHRTSCETTKIIKPNFRRFPCPDCDYIAKTSKGLKTHENKNHGKQGFRCNECEFTTRRNATFHRHQVKLHNYPRSYSCPECDHTSITKYDLEDHILRNHILKKTKALKCSQCDFSTDLPAALKKHLLNHKNSHKFTCYY